MKEFIKTYGGWIISGLLVGFILYLLFRPVPTADNTVLIKKVDSLTEVNNGLRKALNTTTATVQPKIDSLNSLIDTLQDQRAVDVWRLDAAQATQISLAKQVQYYKKYADTQSYDSACDLLAVKVLADSMVIRDFQINTDNIIDKFGQILGAKDSIIIGQQALILSDSVLIRTQRELTTTQTAQLKKAEKRAKVNAWIGRSLAAVVVGLVTALAIK